MLSPRSAPRRARRRLPRHLRRLALPAPGDRDADPGSRGGQSGRSRDRPPQHGPTDDQEQAQPRGGDRPRADDRARALVLLGGLVLGVRLPRAYQLAARRHRRQRRAMGSRPCGPRLRTVARLDHASRRHRVVIVLAILLAVVEYIRRPSRWIAPFLLVVIVGQNALTNGIKELLDRVRPDLNPIAETLGPSFQRPFGDGRGVLRGRRASTRTRPTRASSRLLAGSAVAIAVAVACTRVLLDLLAQRRHRRPRSRLGLVRGLQHRVRRADAPVRRGGRGGGPGGRRGDPEDGDRADGVSCTRGLVGAQTSHIRAIGAITSSRCLMRR